MSAYTSGFAGGTVSSAPPKKTFSKWKWFFIPWPVRSINNKIIFGPMYMRLEHNIIMPKIIRYYATKKELFEAKLKGKA